MTKYMEIIFAAVNEVIGRNLRSIREHVGLTLEQLAHLVNSSPSHLGNIERGIANPTINTLCKLAEVLKVNITNFFEPAPIFPGRKETMIFMANGYDPGDQSQFASLPKETQEKVLSLLNQLQQLFYEEKEK